MIKFILKRLFCAIPVLFAIVTLTFFMIRLAPGGPFTQERQVSPQILESLNEHYGLNDPIGVQYINYLKNVIMLDFGPSYIYHGKNVSDLIVESFPVSLELSMWAIIIALVLGLPIGMVSALKKNSIYDYLGMGFSLVGICIPVFVMGPILILVFGVWLGWFNVSGWYTINDRVLPSITLGLLYAAFIARLTRGGFLEVLQKDYIRTARAKGLSEYQIVTKHALRGGILPVISFLGPTLASMISGSFVIESVFQIPGLGRHFINAAFNRDYTMILGTVSFYAVLVIFFNLLVDVIQALINPKLRFQDQ